MWAPDAKGKKEILRLYPYPDVLCPGLPNVFEFLLVIQNGVGDPLLSHDRRDFFFCGEKGD